MQTSQFSLRQITKRFDDRVLFDRVDVAVRPGEKVGIVGDNGCGKSTLLRIFAGVEAIDNGERAVVSPGGIGYLPQTLDLPPDASVQRAIDLALAELRDLEARMHTLEAALTEESFDEYAGLTAAFEARGGYEADSRVDTFLHALGLPSLERDRELGTLSGGERARLALAATLAGSPELLLLDEPTNDLDDSAMAWLEDHLRAHRGTVLAVTHDRVFLDRLTSVVLEVDEGRVARYGDGYTGYLNAKAAERRRRLFEYEQYTLEVARNERLLESNAVRLDAIPRKLEKAGMGGGPFRARGRDHGAMGRIRNAKQRLTRLDESAVAPPPDPLVFTPSLTSAGGAVELTDIRVADRLWISSLRLEAGERMLVTGPNGAGKTTLLRTIAGELATDSGIVAAPERIGFLRQQGTPWPRSARLLEAFAADRPGHVDEYVDALLALGLFRPAELTRQVSTLSYGQQRRLELARLVSAPTDLLLLDEPTNHLSPVLVEQLEQALESYTGALVIVTHDRLMRQRFSGRRLRLEGGREVSRASS